jgi:hypothetical protein
MSMVNLEKTESMASLDMLADQDASPAGGKLMERPSFANLGPVLVHQQSRDFLNEPAMIQTALVHVNHNKTKSHVNPGLLHSIDASPSSISP